MERNKVLELGRKLLTYPKSADNLILGQWPSQAEKNLSGYWIALMKVANEMALNGDPKTAHQLNRAAGLLLMNGLET